jgi:hypothetical protein
LNEVPTTLIIFSIQFVELKGSVFKKFDKNNLFQVSCSDVRERFHLIILLSIVVLQTMREYSWKSDRLWVLVPDCLMVLLAEMLVDWIKHAFITRFNELQLDVYRDYTTSLAYDMAQTRQKHAFSDHSDLVARRMGFIPLPLGVVMIRVLASAIHINDVASVVLFVLAYFCFASFKILNSLLILGKACDLITQHKQEKATVQSPSTNSAKSTTTTTATSPLRPPVIDQPLKSSMYANGFPPTEIKSETLPSDLGSAAIFANSTVDLKNVSLNEELLKVEGEDIKIEPALEQGEIVTRSFPDINSKQFIEEDLGGDGLKRAESEPSLNTCNSEESDLPK